MIVQKLGKVATVIKFGLDHVQLEGIKSGNVEIDKKCAIIFTRLVEICSSIH